MVAKWKLKSLLICKDYFIVELFWKFYINVFILKTRVIGYYGGIFFSYKIFWNIAIRPSTLLFSCPWYIWEENFSIHPELSDFRVLG